MKKIIVANWKMNPVSEKEAKEIAFAIIKKTPKNIDLVICPPSIFFSNLRTKKVKPNISFGLQNVYPSPSGAFTGEISEAMAYRAGAKFIIVGHSERRGMGESSEFVAEKARETLKMKMIPVICVGESERDSSGAYLENLKKQLLESISGISTSSLKKIIIAYEPIWAIGKDEKDSINSHSLHETSLFLRKVLIDNFGKFARSIPILYGGAVGPDNAEELVEKGDVDGLLVGHLSLKPEIFIKISEAVAKI